MIGTNLVARAALLAGTAMVLVATPALAQDAVEASTAANAAAQALANAAGDRLIHPVETNELFIRLTPAEAARLRASGFDFYDWGEGAARLVTNWSQNDASVRPMADALKALG